MITKPPSGFGQESRAVAATRAGATAGVAAVRAGRHGLRGLMCYAFALLWGFAALAGGLAGSLPTLIGVGLMAAGMAWAGHRSFKQASSAVRLP